MSTKISQLTSATDITASDLMQIVDVEDGVMAPSGTNKKITAQLLADDLAGIVSDGSIATSKLASGALPSGVTVSSTNIVNGTIVDADINASAAIAGSKISPSFTAPSVISVNSSSDALRITQTGSGNAIVVEDSTNPDATPFVVNDQGQLLIGNSTSLVGPFAFSRGLQLTNQGAQFNSFNNNQFGEGIAFVKTRGTPSSPHTIVQLNDTLGAVSFSGSDGSGYVLGSQILSLVDQVPGANDMPTCLTFSTTPDGSATCTERMRITSAGNVGIGTATPVSKLHVAGDLTMSSATVATSATAGTNGDVPAQVAGYLVVSINGTSGKIPYYA
jgi:hypothetical protein